MDPKPEGNGDQVDSGGKGAEKLLPNCYVGALLAIIGSALAFVSYFLDPISYVGLEVPGSAFYLIALAVILVVVGLALAGTSDGPSIGS